MKHMDKLIKVSERIRDHLTQQKAVSEDSYGDCLYRGELGRQCAVGCLIKDSFYSDELEGNNVDSRSVWAAVHGSLAADGIVFDPSDERYLLTLLERWQTYHDGSRKMLVYPYAAWIDNAPEGFSPEVQHQHILEDLKLGGL